MGSVEKLVSLVLGGNSAVILLVGKGGSIVGAEWQVVIL